MPRHKDIEVGIQDDIRFQREATMLIVVGDLHPVVQRER